MRSHVDHAALEHSVQSTPAQCVLGQIYCADRCCDQVQELPVCRLMCGLEEEINQIYIRRMVAKVLAQDEVDELLE